MIRLVAPSTALRDSWWASVLEFGDAHTHGYSRHGFEHADLSDPPQFAEWLATQQRMQTDPPPELVPATLFWIVDDARADHVLGSLQLRHELNLMLREIGGHIGYGVRPGARRRGVATAALAAALPHAAAVGVEQALVTCDDDNDASRRTIERCGGVLEDVRAGKRRYWIRTGGAQV